MLRNKYFIRKTPQDAWLDVTTRFDGVKITAITGFEDRGEAQNVYTAQWVNEQEEDYLLTDNKIVRTNIDLELSFAVAARYAANPTTFNTQAAYDAFVEYVADDGDFYIKSSYVNKIAHVVCLKGVKPTLVKLQRGRNSCILATATLHTLDAPATPS